MDDQESHRVQATFGPAEIGALARPPSQSDCVLLPVIRSLGGSAFRTASRIETSYLTPC